MNFFRYSPGNTEEDDLVEKITRYFRDIEDDILELQEFSDNAHVKFKERNNDIDKLNNRSLKNGATVRELHKEISELKEELLNIKRKIARDSWQSTI